MSDYSFINHGNSPQSSNTAKPPSKAGKVIPIIIGCLVLVGIIVGIVIAVLNIPQAVASVRISSSIVTDNTATIVSEDKFRYMENSSSSIENSKPLDVSIDLETYVQISYSLTNFSKENYLYRFNFASLTHSNCVLSYVDDTFTEAKSIPDGNFLDITVPAGESFNLSIFIKIDNPINDSICSGTIVLDLSIL